MFDRFTDRAKKVMQLANQEAQRFNHEYIGTEHILLGLVKEGTGIAANVLKNMDVDLRLVRLRVEELLASGPEMVTIGKLPRTPRANKVLEYAKEAALDLNHHFIGTEHLLLGLLRESEGNAATVLQGLELQLDTTREEIVRLLGSSDFERESASGDGQSSKSFSDAFRRNTINLNRLMKFLPSPPEVSLDEATIRSIFIGLGRACGNNVFLIGHPIITASYLEQLAERFVNESAPAGFGALRFFQIKRGLDQARMSAVLKEAQKTNSTVLATDLFPNAAVASETPEERLEALFGFQSWLCLPHIRFIVAGGIDDWHYIQRIPDLASSFSAVRLPEFDSKSERAMLDTQCEDLSRAHLVEFEETVITMALDLAQKSFAGKYPPVWHATRILDHAATERRLFGETSESDEQSRLRVAIKNTFNKRQTAMASCNFKLARQLNEDIRHMHNIYTQNQINGLPVVTVDDVQKAVQVLTSNS